MRVSFLFCLFAFAANAATWYAASDGSSTNGTSALPWSVQYAVTNTTGNPYLKPGDTVLFKNGTYSASETNALADAYGFHLIFRNSGTPSAKINYRAENLWGFKLYGHPSVYSSVSNLVIWGWDISWPGTTNRNSTNWIEYSGGPTIYGKGVDLTHNLIQNIGHSGIGSWSGTGGKYIAGNVIRFVGQNAWIDYAGGATGSAMYLQNASLTDEALIQGNITYWNYTTGMKAYGNDNINSFNFKQNIIYSAYEGGIFYHMDQVDSQGFQAVSNYVWDGGASGIRIGYQLGDANPSNAIVANNYVVEIGNGKAMSVEDGWATITVTNNTFVSADYRAIISLEVEGDQTNSIATHDWDYNSYYAGAGTGYGQNSFSVGGTPTTDATFPVWTNLIAGDTHSTHVTSAPPATVSFVFRPSTDTHFAHVAVFNWQTNSTETVDLSAYFPAGSHLAIYDAQAIPTAYTNFTYSGGSVDLDLTRTNRAEMLGVFGGCSGDCRDDVWTGFDPRFRAFVIYNQPQTANLTITGNLFIGP